MGQLGQVRAFVMTQTMTRQERKGVQSRGRSRPGRSVSRRQHRRSLRARQVVWTSPPSSPNPRSPSPVAVGWRESASQRAELTWRCCSSSLRTHGIISPADRRAITQQDQRNRVQLRPARGYVFSRRECLPRVGHTQTQDQVHHFCQQPGKAGTTRYLTHKEEAGVQRGQAGTGARIPMQALLAPWTGIPAGRGEW